MLPDIIIESHIPFIGDTLEGIARVRRLAPEEINASAVRETDALVIRTRTRCDASLLDGSAVKFVATATIGTDHIDFPYCEGRGIEIHSAPGCNAPAVAQYVWSTIFNLLPDIPAGATVGVVGLGHVGSIVAKWGKELGFNILACDPPRALAEKGYDPEEPLKEGTESFATMEDIARKADVITFHTPHTRTGACPTHHLADASFFGMLVRKPLVINSARGPVFDTQALKDALKSGKAGMCALDCWEGEPAIDRELLEMAPVATPHIAGYSLQGKQRATGIALGHLLRFIAANYPDLADEARRRLTALAVPPSAPAHLTLTREAITASYSPLADTAVLKSSPEKFEALRNHYDLRPETGF